jgi:hypothetical protein
VDWKRGKTLYFNGERELRSNKHYLLRKKRVMDRSFFCQYMMINVDWDSPPIYNVYCDDELDKENNDNYSNNHENIVTKCKDCIVVVVSEKEFISLTRYVLHTNSRISFYRDYSLLSMTRIGREWIASTSL